MLPSTLQYYLMRTSCWRDNNSAAVLSMLLNLLMALLAFVTVSPLLRHGETITWLFTFFWKCLSFQRAYFQLVSTEQERCKMGEEDDDDNDDGAVFVPRFSSWR